MHEQWSDRTAAKNLDGLLEHIAPDIVSYEQVGALRYTGIDDVREVRRRGLESSPGRIDFDVPDLTVPMNGDLAVAWGLDRIFADGVESRSRGTFVFERQRPVADGAPAPVDPGDEPVIRRVHRRPADRPHHRVVDSDAVLDP